MIKFMTLGEEVALTFTRFPGGETCVRLPEEGFACGEVGTIVFDFESNSDLFDLALVADAIRRSVHGIKLGLHMGYVPYARQDRVCTPGESLSIKVVADFINALKFEYVLSMDTHSAVTNALFDNFHELTLTTTGKELATLYPPANTVLVIPDAGAAKKVLAFAKVHGYDTVIQAEKDRDVKTGKIVDTIVHTYLHYGTTSFLILDDICDGGRTFIELAKKLKCHTSGDIALFVTHGIFSAGTEVFDGIIDHVYTANPVGATGRKAVEDAVIHLKSN